jgi:type I restriction enzyme R subunit/putative DNA methylase
MASHRGWHSRGYLPHFDQPGLVQSVTFRLGDSLPKAQLIELEQLLPRERSAERRLQIEEWLDQGAGSCILRRPDCAQIVVDCILHGDGAKHRALAWCVMPNHVHLLLQVLPGFPLERIVGAIKAFSSRSINPLLNRGGALWMPDYFDRFVRDDRHFANEVEYIEHNPVIAGLCGKPEHWPYSSAGWRLHGTPPRV